MVTELQDKLRAMAGAEPVASSAVVERARRAMASAVAPGPDHRRWLVAPAIAVAAAVVAAVLIVTPHSQPKPVPYAAKSELGVVLMQAAAATTSDKVTDAWYTKYRDEKHFVDDGSKYGRWVPEATTDYAESTQRKSDAGDYWNDSMKLPGTATALRARLLKDEQESFDHLQGDVASLNREQYVNDQVASDALSSLGRPMKADSRRALLTVLAQLADEGQLDSLGKQTDALGRTGSGFTKSWTEPDGTYTTTDIIDSTTGTLLENQFLIDGRLYERQTYQEMKFV